MKSSILTALLAFGLLVAACSSGGDAAAGVATLSDPDPTTVDANQDVAAADTVVASEESLMEFAQCMRDEGVPMDDPTVDADGNLSLGGGFREIEGLDRATIQAARETCGELLEGVALGFQGSDRSEIEDVFLEYAECMRENGYEDMPDTPGFGPGGPGEPGAGPAIDFEAPEFIAANEVCQDVFADAGIDRLPGPGGGRAGGGGGGNS